MTGNPGERIRHEWRQNARLRWGVLVVVLILGARGVLAVSDSRVELAKQYERDAALLGRLEATASETDWPRRARTAEAARHALVEAIPVARNEGAARADLQARLDQLAKDAVLGGAVVRVETVLDVPGHPELRQAVGRLEGTVAAPLEVAPVARALAAGLPWIQAEQFEVAEAQPARVVAIVRAFYRKAEPTPIGAGGAPASPDSSASDASDASRPGRPGNAP